MGFLTRETYMVQDMIFMALLCGLRIHLGFNTSF